MNRIAFLLVAVAVALAGAALSRRVGSGEAIAPVIRQGLAIDALTAPLPARPTGLFDGIKVAVREAVNILESEGGMLWLLLFLIVFWLARSPS